MTGRYASKTAVSTDKSEGEIKQLLKRYGADQFFFGEEPGRMVAGFRMEQRMIRISVPMPDAEEFRRTATGLQRSDTATRDLRDQAHRQRWRAVLLLIKAKLEAVDVGIVTFEDVFLAETVLPDNSTVGEWAHEQVKQAYLTGRMPALLPAPRGS